MQHKENVDHPDECERGEAFSATFDKALELMCSSATQVDISDERNEDVEMRISASQEMDIAPEEEKMNTYSPNWRVQFEKEQKLRKESMRNLQEARSCSRKLRLKLREERAKTAEIKQDIRVLKEIFKKYVGT